MEYHCKEEWRRKNIRVIIPYMRNLEYNPRSEEAMRYGLPPDAPEERIKGKRERAAAAGKEALRGRARELAAELIAIGVAPENATWDDIKKVNIDPHRPKQIIRKDGVLGESTEVKRSDEKD